MSLKASKSAGKISDRTGTDLTDVTITEGPGYVSDRVDRLEESDRMFGAWIEGTPVKFISREEFRFWRVVVRNREPSDKFETLEEALDYACKACESGGEVLPHEKIQIEIGENPRESAVYVGDTFVDGVTKIEVEAEASEGLTKATIEVIPELVNVDLPDEQTYWTESDEDTNQRIITEGWSDEVREAADEIIGEKALGSGFVDGGSKFYINGPLQTLCHVEVSDDYTSGTAWINTSCGVELGPLEDFGDALEDLGFEVYIDDFALV